MPDVDGREFCLVPRWFEFIGVNGAVVQVDRASWASTHQEMVQTGFVESPQTHASEASRELGHR